MNLLLLIIVEKAFLISSKVISFLRIVHPVVHVAVMVFLVLHNGYYHALNLMNLDLNILVLLMIYSLTFHLFEQKSLNVSTESEKDFVL